MEITVKIPSDLEAASQAVDRFLEEVSKYRYSDADVFAMKLAVEEAMNNALRHGNKFDPAKTVHVSFDIGSDKVVVVIADEGAGFDPEVLPDPTADENIEKPTGRGVMLMKAYMDEVRFNEVGNQVRMVKYRA